MATTIFTTKWEDLYRPATLWLPYLPEFNKPFYTVADCSVAEKANTFKFVFHSSRVDVVALKEAAEAAKKNKEEAIVYNEDGAVCNAFVVRVDEEFFDTGIVLNIYLEKTRPFKYSYKASPSTFYAGVFDPSWYKIMDSTIKLSCF